MPTEFLLVSGFASYTFIATVFTRSGYLTHFGFIYAWFGILWASTHREAPEPQRWHDHVGMIIMIFLGWLAGTIFSALTRFPRMLNMEVLRSDTRKFRPHPMSFAIGALLICIGGTYLSGRFSDDCGIVSPGPDPLDGQIPVGNEVIWGWVALVTGGVLSLATLICWWFFIKDEKLRAEFGTIIYLFLLIHPQDLFDQFVAKYGVNYGLIAIAVVIYNYVWVYLLWMNAQWKLFNRIQTFVKTVLPLLLEAGIAIATWFISLAISSDASLSGLITTIVVDVTLGPLMWIFHKFVGKKIRGELDRNQKIHFFSLATVHIVSLITLSATLILSPMYSAAYLFITALSLLGLITIVGLFVRQIIAHPKKTKKGYVRLESILSK